MRFVLPLVPMLLASCDYRDGPVPDRRDIIRVEQALSKAPCVEKITDLERTYQYHLDQTVLPRFFSSLDRERIDFDLSKAPSPDGARVRRRAPWPQLTETLNELSIGKGSYDLRSGELHFCKTARH